MVSIEYANAYSEVLEILKFISKEDYEKIPNSKIELFETNQNKEYIFEYNPNKTLEEQNVSRRAKAIIGLIFRDYWATDEQKDKIIRKQNYDRQILEKQKQEKYNPDEIFKKKPNNFINTSTGNLKENLEIVEYKEKRWYQKVFCKILKLFRKK